MSWIFRKIFRSGPFQTTISKKGIGMSWGIPGFRIGVSSVGKKYISVGIPGTGLYFIKYLPGKNNLSNGEQQSNIKVNQTKKKITDEPWWKQKDL